MRAQEKPIVTARINPFIAKRLEKYCAKKRLTRQEVIEKALDRFLK